MVLGETLYVRSRKDWRRWLAKYHDKKSEVWLGVYKKSSGRKPTLREAVEEALCFGWIDSQIRSIDKLRYASRFTPRREKSQWSKSNIAKALKMLSEGKMTQDDAFGYGGTAC